MFPKIPVDKVGQMLGLTPLEIAQMQASSFAYSMAAMHQFNKMLEDHEERQVFMEELQTSDNDGVDNLIIPIVQKEIEDFENDIITIAEKFEKEFGISA